MEKAWDTKFNETWWPFFYKELVICLGRFNSNRHHKGHPTGTGRFYKGRELAKMNLGNMRTHKAFLEAWPLGWALKGRWSKMEICRERDRGTLGTENRWW